MEKGVILVTDQVYGDFGLEIEQARQAGLDLVISPAADRETLVRAADPDRVLALYNTYYGPVDGSVMDAFVHLRGIVRCGIGVDTVNLPAAQERGIKVANVPDYCVEEVATHALAMFLALARKLPQSNRLVRKGSWSIPAVKPIRALSSYTVGIIGLGRIGLKLAQLIHPLVNRVVYFDPAVASTLFEAVNLEDLYRMTDTVFLHLPLTDRTRGMINRSVLQRMMKKPLLINVSRGGLMVLNDVVEALDQGWISGTGLDVADGLGEGVTNHALFSFDNVTLSPHSAWYSEQAMARLRTCSIAEAIRLARGEEPLNRVV